MLAYLDKGGWSLWSILVVGGALCLASLRFAWRPHSKRFALLVTMAVATFTMTLHGLLMDMGSWLNDPERGATVDVVGTIRLGTLENISPAGLGGALLCIAAILVIVGTARLATVKGSAVTLGAAVREGNSLDQHGRTHARAMR